MGIKRYSRLVSFLLFLEYGVCIAAIALLLSNPRPNDEYAPLVRQLGIGLSLHVAVCLVASAVTGLLIRRRTGTDVIRATIYASIAALISLPLAIFLVLCIVYGMALTGGQGSWLSIAMGISGYLFGVLVPSAILVRRAG